MIQAARYTTRNGLGTPIPMKPEDARKGCGDASAFGELFGDEGLGGLLAFLPGLQKSCGSNQHGGGHVGENDGLRVDQKTVGKPQKDATQIKTEHGIGEVAAALPVDLHELRHEGKGRAEASHSS